MPICQVGRLHEFRRVIGSMTVYAVCLGMTLAVAANDEQEAVEKARSELQCRLEEGSMHPEEDAWSFDMYQISKMNFKNEVLIFD
jgi:hypothetical protein